MAGKKTQVITKKKLNGIDVQKNGEGSSNLWSIFFTVAIGNILFHLWFDYIFPTKEVFQYPRLSCLSATVRFRKLAPIPEGISRNVITISPQGTRDSLRVSTYRVTTLKWDTQKWTLYINEGSKLIMFVTKSVNLSVSYK